MRLSAVTLARFLAFIETFDLNPRGRVHFRDLVPALVERYGFMKYPQKAEEFDETKGVVFEGGKAGEVGNLRFQIFSGALVVDTTSSTQDSERILEDTLVWASNEFGLAYKPSLVRRAAYLSQVTFHSDVPLSMLHPVLSAISKKLSERVPQFFGLPVSYEPTTIVIGFDPLTLKTAPSAFTIDRRADAPFSENKYFSQAPLPTQEHIGLLEEIERELSAKI